MKALKVVIIVVAVVAILIVGGIFALGVFRQAAEEGQYNYTFTETENPLDTSTVLIDAKIVLQNTNYTSGLSTDANNFRLYDSDNNSYSYTTALDPTTTLKVGEKAVFDVVFKVPAKYATEKFNLQYTGPGIVNYNSNLEVTA